ncbi:MAG: hypothetical protein MR629_02705 [Helicobacter sp.]|uniref:hypothetical protein n=1 Tax=Helicobacter sp. 10-6591 TaxID=2004998 RepID=UPI000DCBFF71|nr:hypothetical protein [Helicobacter sp. 10-6591]MCI6217434.1 hypothetical protein [Helicobacter sp.]MCI7484559.1 hypothetical protein [Helicobacter sp.]MDD7566979.1 hypothetical protein [Helicobacter sp.]MDY5741192.1 hypothetical protein [Helicobacter sp.]RAX54795.1 hypothetical protein CCY97_05320 [Helicobacter sp. 10-6591]
MDEDFSIEELAQQLVDTLSAALFFAGVKKHKIPQALEAYEKLLDDESFEQNEFYGLDEIIQAIKLLRQRHKEFFV